MNILGWHLGRTEQRAAANYTDAVTQAIQDALGTSKVLPTDLAVVESCVALISDPFLVASITGLTLPKRFLYTAARDVLRHGNSVWLIETSTGTLELMRVAKWGVEGSSLSPASWMYNLTLCVPDGEIKRRTPASGVVHLRLAGDADKDWLGKAPWQNASLTADTMGELERGVRDESSIYAGRLWTSPDASTIAQNQAMAASITALKGGHQVVAETTAAGFGQGRIAAPAADWKPVSTGQHHQQGNSFMRTQVEGSLAAAYGVPSAFFNPNGTAPALREAKRQAFLNRTIPMATLFSEELTAKLGQDVRIGWTNLADQSVDVHLRARGAAAVAELVTDKNQLLQLVGLPMSSSTE